MIKSLSDFSSASSDESTDSDLDKLGIPATSIAAVINSLEASSDVNPVSPFQDVTNFSRIKPTSDSNGNIPFSVTVPESKKVTSTGTKPLAPMPSDCIDKMYAEEGFRENTPKHLALERYYGFGYRNLLGELMYPFICSRPDIGYAVTTLSKFSTCPGEYHFKLLKGVARYLKHTIN